jgi:hypothetical protein
MANKEENFESHQIPIQTIVIYIDQSIQAPLINCVSLVVRRPYP